MTSSICALLYLAGASICVMIPHLRVLCSLEHKLCSFLYYTTIPFYFIIHFLWVDSLDAWISTGTIISSYMRLFYCFLLCLFISSFLLHFVVLSYCYVRFIFVVLFYSTGSTCSATVDSINSWPACTELSVEFS